MTEKSGRIKQRTRIQIFPFRIFAVDQVKFLFPRTIFDLLLTGNGFRHGFAFLLINQLDYIVLACKTIHSLVFVLRNPFEDIAGYTRVENSIVLVGHNVHTRMKFSFHCPLHSSLRGANGSERRSNPMIVSEIASLRSQ